MKKYTAVLIPILFLNSFIFASNQIYIKAGPNVSYFLDAKNSSAMMGYALSINKEFILFKELATSVGLGYAQRGAVLKDRTISPYYTGTDADAYYWDIEGRIGYIEFPLLIIYDFNLKNYVKLNLFMGLNLSNPIQDLSRFKQNDLFMIYNAINNPNHFYLVDYHFEQESGFGNNKWEKIYNAGVRIQYRRMGLEFNYQINNKDVYNFSNVSKIYFKIYSVYCQITFEF